MPTVRGQATAGPATGSGEAAEFLGQVGRRAVEGDRPGGSSAVASQPSPRAGTAPDTGDTDATGARQLETVPVPIEKVERGHAGPDDVRDGREHAVEDGLRAAARSPAAGSRRAAR